MQITIPDFSTAAWRAAQARQAAPYLDYVWMIDVSRAYETYALYARIADQIIDAMSVVTGAPPTLDALRPVLGRLLILNGVHGQLQERLERVLERSD